jgi:hypothetical protein
MPAPRRTELCARRQILAASYLAADTSYTKALAELKDSAEDSGLAASKTMCDLKRTRDLTLSELSVHCYVHGC